MLRLSFNRVKVLAQKRLPPQQLKVEQFKKNGCLYTVYVFELFDLSDLSSNRQLFRVKDQVKTIGGTTFAETVLRLWDYLSTEVKLKFTDFASMEFKTQKFITTLNVYHQVFP